MDQPAANEEPYCEHRDCFCFVCGHFVISQNRRKITEDIEEPYRLYFRRQLMDLMQHPWVPKTICTNCHVNLRGWYRGTKRHMLFASPTIWMEPGEHNNFTCHFCTNFVSTTGMARKRLHSRKYRIVPSVIMPVMHSSQLPAPPCPLQAPILISQGYFNDLVRDLELTQTKAEILFSRLRDLNLLEPGVCLLQNKQ